MEGVEEGRQLEKVAIARWPCLSEGESLIGKLPIETISQTAGLSVDEIERLSNSLQ